jgi:hypothetical protein
MDKKPKMTKEEKRAILKAKLREKIRGKSSNRLGKNHKNSQYNKAQEALKTMVSSMQQDSESAGASQININDMLKSVIPDAKSRKINEKRIEKMIKESQVKVSDINNSTDEAQPSDQTSPTQ